MAKKFIIKEHFLLPIFLKRRNHINHLPNDFFQFVDEVIKDKPEFYKQMPVDLLEKYERGFMAMWHFKQFELLKAKTQRRYKYTFEGIYYKVFDLSIQHIKDEKSKYIEIQKAIKNLS